jgi:TetR/AcrR family transcriptional regulator, repressor of fatR-cypB operon
LPLVAGHRELAYANFVEVAMKPFYVEDDEAPAKRKILIAALGLFVRDGLCETSIRDIAKASGFTNPALFKHFSGKDALADYLFRRCYLELFRIVHGIVEGGGSFPEKQRTLIEAYLAAVSRDSNSVLYVQEGLRFFWPRMPAEVRRHSILGEIRKMLEDGQRHGFVTKAIDLKLLTTAWVGTLQQLVRAKYFGDFQQSSQDLAQSLETLLMKMVQP